MSDDPEPSKDDLQKKAWKRWFDIDFSWDGLSREFITTIEHLDHTHNFNEKEIEGFPNLQAYWLSDPKTNEPRTEQQLIDNGELIFAEGQKAYHITHLPLFYDLEGTISAATSRMLATTICAPLVSKAVSFKPAAMVSLSRILPFGPLEDVSEDFANQTLKAGKPYEAATIRVFATIETVVIAIIGFLAALAARRRFQIS